MGVDVAFEVAATVVGATDGEAALEHAPLANAATTKIAANRLREDIVVLLLLLHHAYV